MENKIVQAWQESTAEERESFISSLFSKLTDSVSVTQLMLIKPYIEKALLKISAVSF